MKFLGPLFLVVLLAACGNRPAVERHAQGAGAEGRMFAQASCGGCHGIGHDEFSSNPSAPPFTRIVNQEGLTRETLSTWLHGAHNYPLEMNFALSQREADLLVDYMLTLREAGSDKPAH